MTYTRYGNIIRIIYYTHRRKYLTYNLPDITVSICRRSILSVTGGVRVVSLGPWALAVEFSTQTSPYHLARWTHPSPIWRLAVAHATASWTQPSPTTSSTLPSASSVVILRPNCTLSIRLTGRTCFSI